MVDVRKPQRPNADGVSHLLIITRKSRPVKTLTIREEKTKRPVLFSLIDEFKARPPSHPNDDY
jgi:hypothetical protein